VTYHLCLHHQRPYLADLAATAVTAAASARAIVQQHVAFTTDMWAAWRWRLAVNHLPMWAHRQWLRGIMPAASATSASSAR
jgi:hypothetical protein